MGQRYDSTGRPMMAMIWEAIANIPDRVQEVAALVDPNELRFKRGGCFDVGVRCGGWGNVILEASVMDREAASQLRA